FGHVVHRKLKIDDKMASQIDPKAGLRAFFGQRLLFYTEQFDLKYS
ncbi:MAG: hypothetical protein RIQ50_1077, partial [Bacteroidota bacterium]